MAAVGPLYFVVFTEMNYKDNELYTFYLQLNGNELDLTTLNRFLSKADYSNLYGDYSRVSLDLNTILPESVVDEKCRLDPSMSTKCTGKFIYEYSPNDETYDKYDVAGLMSDMFFGGRIKRGFREPEIKPAL